jgi:hypothetical protein
MLFSCFGILLLLLIALCVRGYNEDKFGKTFMLQFALGFTYSFVKHYVSFYSKLRINFAAVR